MDTEGGINQNIKISEIEKKDPVNFESEVDKIVSEKPWLNSTKVKEFVSETANAFKDHHRTLMKLYS